MKNKILSVILIVTICSMMFSFSAEAEEEIYQVNIQMTAIETFMPGIPDVEDAINAITIPEIGVSVHIIPVFIGNLPADTAYAMASDEKLDILNVGLTNDMTSMVSEGLLLPLDELLETHGSAVMEVTAQVAEAQKINGITYAISQYPYAANSTGFYYNKNMAKEYGIQMHDGMSLEELTEAGAVLKEHGVSLMAVGLSPELNYKFFCPMETFGESGNYGVILNPSENATIINIYESEELREFYRTIRKWWEEGYLPENQLLESASVGKMFADQKIFALPTNITAKQIGHTGNSGFETGLVKKTEPLITTSGAEEFMLGISSTCKNPEKTMDFINYLYTNPEVANLLNFGIEGVDYFPVEGTEHVITTDGIENNRYGSGFVSFGNPLQLKIKAPLTDSYYQELIDWENSAERSLSFGYTFDVNEFAVEAIHIGKILDEYLPLLNVGFAADVDGQMDALAAELKAAGIDRIIEANNKGLQEYLN